MAEQQNTKDENIQKKPFNIKELLDWVKSIGAALIIAFLILNFVIVNVVIPTGSMISTINIWDRVIANRLQYLFSEPQRADIVVFKYPDDEKLTYVKRLIGLPGETVEIKEGAVFINGDKLDEPYLKESTEGTFGPYKVPAGMYFMLGDNRNNSKDSRYWQNTYVSKKKILGKVIFRYFPSFRLYGKSE